MGKWINIDDLPSGRVEWDDIFDAPSIDIVRCKECKHRYVMGDTTLYYGCDFMDAQINDNDYCSYGQRGVNDDK